MVSPVSLKQCVEIACVITFAVINNIENREIFMYKLTPEKYCLVKPLIQDCSAELSVFTVLEGIMPGDVYVDSDQKPRSALIRTSETVVLAGTPYNTQFNEFIKANVLGYWENFMFDTPDWETKIPEFHKNPFIRRYTRRHLTCNNLVYTNYRNDLRPGFTLKQIEPEKLAAEGLKNTDIVMKWVGNWGNFENFRQNAAGFIIHNDDTIVSWSVTDCVFGDKAAIGIVTDQDFRDAWASQQLYLLPMQIIGLKTGSENWIGSVLQ